MERRFTAFVLPALIVVLVWMMMRQQTAPPPAPSAPSPTGFNVLGPSAKSDDIFTHDFGVPGQPGFRVTFDRRGGAVHKILLLDHYVSIEARDKATHESADYYPIAKPSPDMVMMLVLEDYNPPRFKNVRIDEAVDKRATAGDGSAGGSGDSWRWTPTVKDNEVRLLLDCRDGHTLEKVFRYQPGRRDLELEVRLSSTLKDDPDLGSSYVLSLRGVMLPNPKSEHVIGGNPAMALAGWRDTQKNKDAHVVKRELPHGRIENLVSGGGNATVTWGGSTNRFFCGFLMADDSAPDSLNSVNAEPLPDPPDATKDLLAYSVPYPHYGLRLGVPKAGETSSVTLRLYLGPKSFGAFASQPEYARLDPVMTEDLTAPGCFNFCNIPGVTWMAVHLLKLLEFLHGIVGNWGFAIILLTVLVKVAVFFLNFRSQKSMRAFGAKMARVKPELDAVQSQWKADPKRLQQEMMLLYKKHKMFPPLGGCLPLFLTMPVFFGLFTALRVSYDLRQQPFVAWIQDLSAPDALFHLGWTYVPYFNVLPIIWMVMYSIMMFRMKLPTDPQQRTMQQVMRWMFLLFGVLLYNYASGLLVYMCTSMALAFFEQWLIKKILGPMPDVAGMTSMPQF